MNIIKDCVQALDKSDIGIYYMIFITGKELKQKIEEHNSEPTNKGSSIIMTIGDIPVIGNTVNITTSENHIYVLNVKKYGNLFYEIIYKDSKKIIYQEKDIKNIEQNIEALEYLRNELVNLNLWRMICFDITGDWNKVYVNLIKSMENKLPPELENVLLIKEEQLILKYFIWDTFGRVLVSIVNNKDLRDIIYIMQLIKETGEFQCKKRLDVLYNSISINNIDKVVKIKIYYAIIRGRFFIEDFTVTSIEENSLNALENFKYLKQDYEIIQNLKTGLIKNIVLYPEKDWSEEIYKQLTE